MGDRQLVWRIAAIAFREAGKVHPALKKVAVGPDTWRQAATVAYETAAAAIREGAADRGAAARAAWVATDAAAHAGADTRLAAASAEVVAQQARAAAHAAATTGDATASPADAARAVEEEFNAIKYRDPEWLDANGQPWLKTIHRDAHAQPFAYLEKAWKRYFADRKAGKPASEPQFKKKGKSRDSFYVANDKFRMSDWPERSATWALGCFARRWNTRRNATAPGSSSLTAGIRVVACVRSVVGRTRR
jgi:hypothetical protein